MQQRGAGMLVACCFTSTCAFVTTSAPSRPQTASRSAAVRLAANIFDNCPLLSGCPFGTDAAPPSSSPPTPKERDSPLEVATTAAEQLERSLQSALGTSQPFACAASEAVVETVVRSACEEIGSCEVTVESTSSARLLRGELDRARIRASGVSAAGLRFSSADVEAEVINAQLRLPHSLSIGCVHAYPSPARFARRSLSRSIPATPSPTLLASPTSRPRRRRDSGCG